MKKLAGVFFLLILNAHLVADDGRNFDGTALREECRLLDSNPNSHQSGMCLGFVNGVHAGHLVIHEWSKMEPFYCAPDGLSHKQVALIVVKFMDEHPELLDINAESIVLCSLASAFPCPVEPVKPKK